MYKEKLASQLPLFSGFGTLGTPKVKLRARAREDSTGAIMCMVDFHGKLKDLDRGVPSVPILGRLGRVFPSYARVREKFPPLTNRYR